LRWRISTLWALGARKKADLIIKNTYRTLMTRGMKGCYVYCTDRETREYFRERLVGKRDGFDPASGAQKTLHAHQR